MCMATVPTIKDNLMFTVRSRGKEKRRKEKWEVNTGLLHMGPQFIVHIFSRMGRRHFYYEIQYIHFRFLTTGCQSADYNSKIHLLCYKGIGNSGRQEEFPARGGTGSVVWGWGNQTYRRRNLKKSAFLLTFSLKQGFILLQQLLFCLFVCLLASVLTPSVRGKKFKSYFMFLN